MSEATTRTREDGRVDVEKRLLDAAEDLFAERGFAGAGVREITERAGARLAAVSERFGGKEQLFRAVVLRRIQPLNEDRRRRLSALPARGSRERRLRALLEAFAEPMRQRAGEPGWDRYFRLIAQLANSGHPIRTVIADEFNDIAADVIAHLQAIFPGASDAAVHDAYLHLVAATMHTYSNNHRLDSLTAGRLHARDLDDRHEALLRFAAGGITRLVT